MSKFAVISVALLAVAAVLATDALAGEGRRERRGRPGIGRLRGRMKARRAEAPKFLQSLGVTDAQRAVVLEKARAAAPVVSGARDEARRILARAWAAAAKDPSADRAALRASVRADLKALKEKVRAEIEPLAKDVVGAITPEQRALLEANAKKHGRTVDDARLTRFAARLIARPMTSVFLEERLGR